LCARHLEGGGRTARHNRHADERSTQQLSEQVGALNKAYGFKQGPYHEGEIVRDEIMVLENMVLYVVMVKASDTAKEQRALIDNVLYSPTVRSDDESQ
jgi:hypothetical protein